MHVRVKPPTAAMFSELMREAAYLLATVGVSHCRLFSIGKIVSQRRLGPAAQRLARARHRRARRRVARVSAASTVSGALRGARRSATAASRVVEASARARGPSAGSLEPPAHAQCDGGKQGSSSIGRELAMSRPARECAGPRPCLRSRWRARSATATSRVLAGRRGLIKGSVMLEFVSAPVLTARTI